MVESDSEMEDASASAVVISDSDDVIEEDSDLEPVMPPVANAGRKKATGETVAPDLNFYYLMQGPLMFSNVKGLW